MRERPLPALVAATDDERLAGAGFTDRLEALLAAGCPAVLLRGGRLPARRLYNLVCEGRERCTAHGAELWVGDRVDIARVCGADGVQLPERGLSIAGARRGIGPGVRIGRSVHSSEAALTAAGDGADHLVVGTIFATATHPGTEPSGAVFLTTVRAALDARGMSVPLLAIGGMTPERVQAVMEAGAAGVVAIRALWDAEDPATAVREFLARFGRGPDETLH